MTASADIQTILSTADIFGGLDASQLDALVAKGRTRKTKRGELLFSRGDEGDAMFAVLSGRVLLSRSTPEGQEVALASMSSGEVFGELALLDNSPRSTDATVVEPGELFIVYRSDFVAAVEADNRLALSLLSLFASRLRETNRLVESISFLELGPRLARLLELLAKRAQTDDQGRSMLASRFTQAELAKRIAASRESVSKQIAQWTREGLISQKDGRLVIIDREALADIADDPDLDADTF
ncbi:MAG: Crp/Fnr family transcriptional regulator [Pseudomonadota bacterium]